MTQTLLDPRKLIFSGTASHRGRAISVSPQNSDLSYLHYGRIRLDSTLPRVAFDTGGRETALLCMSGRCHVAVNGYSYDIDLYDAIYVPPGAAVEVTTEAKVDLVECSAEVSGSYALQVVRYADVLKSPLLKFRSGGPSTSRDLN